MRDERLARVRVRDERAYANPLRRLRGQVDERVGESGAAILLQRFLPDRQNAQIRDLAGRLEVRRARDARHEAASREPQAVRRQAHHLTFTPSVGSTGRPEMLPCSR